MGLCKFKKFWSGADSVKVKASVLPPHEVRSNPRDLEALATIWRWEGITQRLLPRVLATGQIEARFQAIFDVRSSVPVLRGYEAYARFPAAPRIPAGLWFSTAERVGLSEPLSLTAGRVALRHLDRLPSTTVLFVNTQPEVAAILASDLPESVAARVVFDIPGAAFDRAETAGAVEFVRACGVGVSFDDEALAGDSLDRVAAAEGLLDFVKIDALNTTESSLEASRRLSSWCHRRGVFLVAKRAEGMSELDQLRDAGIDWAQGHILSRPVNLST